LVAAKVFQSVRGLHHTKAGAATAVSLKLP
jgi:hypothetical protein